MPCIKKMATIAARKNVNEDEYEESNSYSVNEYDNEIIKYKEGNNEYEDNDNDDNDNNEYEYEYGYYD